ncbi:hypothetical protein ILUMI_17077, partial [Ignelater luminosus]
MGRFRKTFTPEYENVLAEHVKDLANRLMPLNKQKFLSIAFQLAEILNVLHQFTKSQKSAGKHFYYDFMQRHSDLSLRTAESSGGQILSTFS